MDPAGDGKDSSRLHTPRWIPLTSMLDDPPDGLDSLKMRLPDCTADHECPYFGQVPAHKTSTAGTGIYHSRAPSGVYLLYTIRAQGFYLPLFAQFILTISTRCNGVFADS